MRRIVSERLGHATVAITSDPYGHVSPTMHGRAANLVAGLLNERSEEMVTIGSQAVSRGGS